MKGSCRSWHNGYDVQLSPAKLWFDTLEVTNLFYLIAMRLACGSNGEGGSRVSWLLQNGGI